LATGDKFERQYISNSHPIFVASIKHDWWHDQICVCKRCTGYFFFGGGFANLHLVPCAVLKNVWLKTWFL